MGTHNKKRQDKHFFLSLYFPKIIMVWSCLSSVDTMQMKNKELAMNIKAFRINHESTKHCLKIFLTESQILNIGLKVPFKVHFYFIVKANFILKFLQIYNEIS